MINDLNHLNEEFSIEHILFHHFAKQKELYEMVQRTSLFPPRWHYCFLLKTGRPLRTPCARVVSNFQWLALAAIRRGCDLWVAGRWRDGSGRIGSWSALPLWEQSLREIFFNLFRVDFRSFCQDGKGSNFFPFQADEETPEIRDAVLPSGTVAAEGLVAWFRSCCCTNRCWAKDGSQDSYKMGAPRLPEPIVDFCCMHWVWPPLSNSSG